MLNDNNLVKNTESLLDTRKLLGFKQIAEVCKTARNTEMSENAGRLLSKIGPEVPPPSPPAG